MASVLETFYILFKTNGEDVEKGIKKNSAALSTFEADALKAEAVVGAAGEYIGHIFDYVAVRIASAFAIEKVVEFVGEISEVNAQLGITAERIGVNVEDLDAWSRAARAAGGTSEGFVQSLDSLNRGLGRVAATGTSRLKPFFDELGIKLLDAPHHARPLMDVLSDLADRFSKMDKQSSAAIGESLMIDPGTVLLLQKGKEGVAELVEQQRALGVVTEEDAKKAHEYENAVRDLESRLHFIATEIAGGILPGLKNFFDKVSEIIAYLAQHKGLIEGFFIGAAAAITYVFRPAIEGAIIDSAALIAEWLLMAAPFILIGAAIALLVDDVQHFLAGQNSVIGELSKKWPEVGEIVRAVVQGIGEAWKFATDLIANGAHLIESIIFGVGAAFAWAGGKVGEFANWFTQKFPAVASVIKTVAGILGDVVKVLAEGLVLLAKFHLNAIAAIPRVLGDVADVIDKASGRKTKSGPAAPAGSTPAPEGTPTPRARPTPNRGPLHAAVGAAAAAAITVGVNAAQTQIRTGDATPLNSVAHHISQTTQNRAVTVGPITVNIDAPGANSQEIAGHVATHIHDAFRQAVDQHDDGVQN